MSTVEVPTGLVIVASLYTAITIVIGLVVSLLTSPALVVNRPKRAYFDDWNDALKAPWLFWHIGGWLYRLQEVLGNYVLPAPQRATDVVAYMMRSQAVITLAELGVADQLLSGPKTAQQLAADLKVHEPYLARLLRFTARIGFFKTSKQGGVLTYDLNQLSAVLTESHPNSVKHMVRLFGDHWHAFGHLTEGVRTGQTPYKLYAGGKSHWQHMTELPELYTRFNKAMTNFNTMTPIEAVFREYSFAPFTRLTDVGGGLGSLTAAVLKAQPKLTATLFDLPKVVEQAKQSWATQHAAVLPRATFVGGSFLDEGQVPAAQGEGEVFVLRQILHDWSDADSIKILKQVRAAIGHRGAKLLLVEACIARSMTATHTPRIAGDIHMMVQYGDAMERDEDQFAALLSASGFRLNKVVPTKSLLFVLEALPV